ncbi:MAG: helix-turn-helix domain-containing protein [Barnesiella sp.]|nr:helix-turn-helix domain-containing protein [Barnesiella sp.]MBD5253213.1 helix-turn-helix domain-containing protein [Barnesiella sp.]
MNEEVKQMLQEIKNSVIVMMKNVWSVTDLAMVLDITPSRVRHLAADKVVPSYKQNGSLYFKRDEIEAWQTANRSASMDELNASAATYCALSRIKSGKSAKR